MRSTVLCKPANWITPVESSASPQPVPPLDGTEIVTLEENNLSAFTLCDPVDEDDEVTYPDESKVTENNWYDHKIHDNINDNTLSMSW